MTTLYSISDFNEKQKEKASTQEPNGENSSKRTMKGGGVKKEHRREEKKHLIKAHSESWSHQSHEGLKN